MARIQIEQLAPGALILAGGAYGFWWLSGQPCGIAGVCATVTAQSLSIDVKWVNTVIAIVSAVAVWKGSETTISRLTKING